MFFSVFILLFSLASRGATHNRFSVRLDFDHANKSYDSQTHFNVYTPKQHINSGSQPLKRHNVKTFRETSVKYLVRSILTFVGVCDCKPTQYTTCNILLNLELIVENTCM